MGVTTLFCEIDDFCQDFEPMLNEHLISDSPRAQTSGLRSGTIGNRKRLRRSTLALSEVMTIIETPKVAP